MKRCQWSLFVCVYPTVSFGGRCCSIYLAALCLTHVLFVGGVRLLKSCDMSGYVVVCLNDGCLSCLVPASVCLFAVVSPFNKIIRLIAFV